MKSTFSIYDAADSQRLMTLVCATSTSTPSATRRGRSPTQVSNLKNELVDEETFAAGSATTTTGTGSTHHERMVARPTAPTSGGCARPTRSTSTT